MREKLGVDIVLIKKKERKSNKEWTDLSSCVGFLKELVEKEDPQSFGVNWIKERDDNLYRKILVFMSKDGLDWDDVIDGMLPELSSRWKRFKRQKRFPDFRPKEEYEDNGEMELFLKEHEDYLYTFFDILEDEDMERREEICKGLVSFAQKGNLNAKDKLMDLIEPLVQVWIENRKDFGNYAYNSDSLWNRIEKCIYYYDSKEKTPFIGYVYASLKKEAKSFAGENFIDYEEAVGYV